MASARPFVGYVVLTGMIVIWITMSELLQNLQTDYEKPLFITCVIHSSYAVFLLPWAVCWMLYRKSFGSISIQDRYGLSIPKLLGMALVSSTLNSLCSYAWYLSLSRTTVAANNSIYQSCSAIVYVLSIVWLKEKVTVLKTVAVCASVGGVILISTAKAPATHVRTAPIGYVWLMVSVFAYAVYEIVQKRCLAHDIAQGPSQSPPGVQLRDVITIESFEEASSLRLSVAEEGFSSPLLKPGSAAVTPEQMTLRVGATAASHHSPAVRLELALLMLGLCGLASALLTPPLVGLWHITHAEPFQLPPHDKLAVLFGNCGLDSLSNILLLFGILITSPLFISVGLMLVMPASIVTDRLIHGTVMTPMGVCGAVAIVIGFTLLNITPEAASRWGKAAKRWVGL